MYTTLIKNATIIDGTGEKSYIGSIALKDGVIADVGTLVASKAEVEIDALGLTVMPGFVDIHRHGDLVPFNATNKAEELRQGITSFINGNCGFSAVPSSIHNFESLREYSLPIMGCIPKYLCGQNFSVLSKEVDKIPLYSNVGYLVGNGALRIAVKGFEKSSMTPHEIDRVCNLLREDLEAGAFGLSLGLMYVPENYYSTDDLIRICKVVADYGRLVTVHMRGEGNSLLQSIDEVFHIASKSGAAFHISHLKVAGKRNWKTLIFKALEKIYTAQQKGLDITFDVYPYNAGSTALYTLLPPALQQGGISKMLECLRDQSIRKKISEELKCEQNTWDNLIASTGWQSVVVIGSKDSTLNGQSIVDIAQQRECTSEECVFDLLLENDGNVAILLYATCNDDMLQVLKTPGAIVISDALYSESGISHPRRYGSQARFLSMYSDMLGIEAAVQSVTDLPAQRMGLVGRGRIVSGYIADLLLLDCKRFRDTATFEVPKQYPTGIVKVFVAGREAFGEQTGVLEKFGGLLYSK